MISTSRQACNWQIEKVQLSRPFELRCPHCNFLYSRFWANGLEEHVSPLDFVDCDQLRVPFEKGSLQWSTLFVWGSCFQCSRYFFTVELTAASSAFNYMFPAHDREPETVHSLPKFGVRITNCYPSYLLGTWLGLHDEKDGVPVEAILIGLLPLEKLPSPVPDTYCDTILVGKDPDISDLEYRPERLIAKLLYKSFKRLYTPFLSVAEAFQ